MAEIIPAIASSDFSVVQDRVATLEGVSDWAHIDIADGLFVPHYTWQGAERLGELVGKIKLEVHLMIEHPEVELLSWLQVADRVIVHPESTEGLDEILAQSDDHHEIIPAYLLKTELETQTEVLTKVKSVQLMSIRRLGHHGEPFDEAVIPRIKFLRARYPDVKISIDGGVNSETARQCLIAGAHRLVCGSAIWQASNPLHALRVLQAI